MIKVIIGYKVRKGADFEPVLLKLRSNVMTFPGFIGAENLQNVKDTSIVAIIQSWDKDEDWKAWEPSTIRRSILQEAKPLLTEEPRVTVFRVMPTGGWSNSRRDS